MSLDALPIQCMGKELKKLGLAAVNHYPVIEDTYLAKMYTLFASNTDDAQLFQYKVSQKLTGFGQAVLRNSFQSPNPYFSLLNTLGII
jgi:hypothetical protein